MLMRSSTVSGVNTGGVTLSVRAAARARTRLRRLEGNIPERGCTGGRLLPRDIVEWGRKRASVCETIERVKCVL
jgi:hypothetical protein